MKSTFEEVMDGLARANPGWKVEKSEFSVKLTNRDREDECIYLLEMTEKVRNKVPETHFIYRLKCFSKDELISDSFQWIVDYKNSPKRIGCAVWEFGKFIKPKVTIHQMDENFSNDFSDLEALENMKNEIEIFVDEILELKEYRLHGIYL